MKKEVLVNGESKVVDVIARTGDQAVFIFNNVEYHFYKSGSSLGKMVLMRNGISTKVPVAYTSKGVGFIAFEENDFKVENRSKGRNAKKSGSDHGHMISPMPGKILKVVSTVGDSVKKGDPILIMEAMKMEHTIKANCNGKIREIHCNEGDQVSGGIELVTIDEDK